MNAKRRPSRRQRLLSGEKEPVPSVNAQDPPPAIALEGLFTASIAWNEPLTAPVFGELGPIACPVCGGEISLHFFNGKTPQRDRVFTVELPKSCEAWATHRRPRRKEERDLWQGQCGHPPLWYVLRFLRENSNLAATAAVILDRFAETGAPDTPLMITRGNIGVPPHAIRKDARG